MGESKAKGVVTVTGAREHNLKGVDLEFPRDALVTFTGVSGSGKSSLAYHTIYQEGQRRFLESLSSYARQFLGKMEKPRVDHVDGLSPTVSIDQKSVGHGKRSTVGTLTEVLDFLRLWWARLGEPACPECGARIEAWSVDRIVAHIAARRHGQKAIVLAPVVRERKGEYRKELHEWRTRGFVRARIDGEVRRLDEDIELHRYKYHTIELVTDRLRIDQAETSRLAEAVEQALDLAKGTAALLFSGGSDGDEYETFSTSRACPEGHGSLPELEPRLFSFNSPVGACAECDGLGETHAFSEDLLVADPELSIREGALNGFTDDRMVYSRISLDQIEVVAEANGFDLDTPWRKLTRKQQKIMLFGTGRQTFEFRWRKSTGRFRGSGVDKKAFPGLIGHLQRVYRPSRARHLDRFRSSAACPACEGARLGPAARAVAFDDKSLPEVAAWTVDAALAFFEGVELSGNRATIAREIRQEILKRLVFLSQVGLGYLTLDRRAHTLSGGESQRIRLAAQVGAGLRGILYVLDEPSIGLHARDQARLLATLRALRDRGNTVCVVEHDEDTMSQSDFLVDVGPGAGRHGGEIVVAGTPDEVRACEASLTGQYLRRERSIPIPDQRRLGNGKHLVVEGASHHNLQAVTAKFPLGCLTVVAGVSGSGKSTLVNHILKGVLRRELHNSLDVPGRHKRVRGIEHVDKLVEIDQSPIGRTPRSNPATYTGVWTYIRDLYAALPESRLREYQKGRFSFNVEGGRCEECSGAGIQQLEMNFLAPVEVECDVCSGRRFNPETLEIRFKDHSVYDVLEMTIEDALAFFEAFPKIERALRTLNDVGLGYIKLGQPSTTLSGGEAQRVKLATELQRPATGQTLYLLDEPTTGLHFEDVARLLGCLQVLVDGGNSVLVIEHNLDVIAAADHVLELGPEGGAGGGLIVAAGTPEEVAAAGTATGDALLPLLRERGLMPGQKRTLKKTRKKARTKRQAAAAAATTRTAPPTHITVGGARLHNLQGVDVEVPLDQFTVITGPSGSGKTSLAFHTIFSEGQRRFIESMSTYARRFLGRLDRAPVDVLEGLGPSIAIDQKAGSRSPRSTVATTTEIHDYLRLLYARVGRPHCPTHGQELVLHSPSRIATEVIKAFEGKKGYVLAPIRLPESLTDDHLAHYLEALRAEWQKDGFVRVLVDGAEHRLEQPIPLTDGAPVLHLVIDRLAFKDRSRIVDSVAQASERGDGIVELRTTGGEHLTYSTDRSCPHCGHGFPSNPHPRVFSFNHHSGACPSCDGLGDAVGCAPELLVNHPDKPVFDGGIDHKGGHFTFLTKKRGGYYYKLAQIVAKEHGFDLATPWQDLDAAAQQILLYGDGAARYRISRRTGGGGSRRSWSMDVQWRGFARQVEAWAVGTESESGAQKLAAVMRRQPCPDCQGERLAEAQRHVYLGARGELSLGALCRQTVDQALVTLDKLRLRKKETAIAQEALAEVRHRLTFLRDVGLGYLGLDRSASTLSGGEAQRIRLATQLGNRLVGVLYVLDEPTIGLHPRDTDRLLGTLRGLRDLGNTVLAVEHDEGVIRAADHVIDMGPGAGHHGGRVVAQGAPKAVAKSQGLTGRYLRGELGIPVPDGRRLGTGTIRAGDLCAHNVEGVDLELPMGALTVVTGVSGSGKSSIIMDALVPAIADGGAAVELGAFAGMVGVAGSSSDRAKGRSKASRKADTGQAVAKGRRKHAVVVVDQSPVGSTPSSNPATYAGIMTPIRTLFAQLPESKVKGFGPGRFSFNVADGRCADCEGKGKLLVEMHFLADVWVTCETCRGKRYNQETLQVQWRGKSIADVLEMEVADAAALFVNHRQIHRPLQLLVDVGLGYLRLGQAANTLSGGESQRLKLVAQLAKRPKEHTIYVLDEPTTGLHMDDVHKLVIVLERLVDRGDTVIVIEHHLDVMARADFVLEMGPEAGAGGGQVVALGRPEDIANAKTHTAPFLAEQLGRRTRGKAPAKSGEVAVESP